MSNIELFKNAFAVNFPVEVAQLVLNRIADLHGADLPVPRVSELCPYRNCFCCHHNKSCS